MTKSKKINRQPRTNKTAERLRELAKSRPADIDLRRYL